MITIEITAAIDAAGTEQTFYFSDKGFSTKPTDTPASINFLDRFQDQGKIGVNAFSDGRTGGATKLETGEIVLVNNDGYLDNWAQFSFEGRKIVMRCGEIGSAYPAGFQILFSGTMDTVSTDFDKVVVTVKDKQAVLGEQLLTTLYLGTNTPPNGAEGTAADIKGKVKPWLLGKVFNASPVLVNSSKLMYQLSKSALSAISAVYDRGVALTPGTDFASQALLEAATPAASTFITCLSAGLFRLGSNPAGIITADATQGAAASDRTAAQLLKQIALQAGITAPEIDASDITALDALAAYELGIYITDTVTAQACMDKVAGSVGAWYGFDGAGVLRMGQLSAPSGTTTKRINDYEIKKQGMQRRAPKDNGVPVWQVTVNHTKLFTIQNNDLAGAVTAARRAYLSEEYRSEVAEDATIKSQWKLSSPMKVDTLLTGNADATAEAARLLTLYKARRQFYDIPIDINKYASYNIKLMDLVEVVLPRFNMGSGKLFKVLGYRIESGRNRVILVLWG